MSDLVQNERCGVGNLASDPLESPVHAGRWVAVELKADVGGRIQSALRSVSEVDTEQMPGQGHRVGGSRVGNRSSLVDSANASFVGVTDGFGLVDVVVVESNTTATERCFSIRRPRFL